MKKYIAYALLAGLFGAQVHAYTSFGADDLIIKNTTTKTIGIFWLVGPWTPGNDASIEAAIGNPGGNVFIAALDKQIGRSYFPIKDIRSLKKKDLQLTMGTNKAVTGALFYDNANPNNQVVAQFSQFKTGTVKREGMSYPEQKMKIYLSGGKLALRKW